MQFRSRFGSIRVAPPSMLALPLVGVAAAACALPAAIDPHATCVEDANGFATLDADSDPAVPISLAISAKGETTDAFSVVHLRSELKNESTLFFNNEL